MSGAATVEDGTQPWESARPSDAQQFHLVIAWSLEEPGRIGESAAITGPTMLGRGEPEHMQGTSVARFVRWRPCTTSPGPPLGDSRISRSQLFLRPKSDGSLGLENVGRCKLFINGEEASAAVLRAGDTITLRNALVLLVVRRDARFIPRGDATPASFAFAGPDRHGIVGESAATWQLRAELAFAAGTDHHVLLRGASGVGKELAARALHALSSRAGKPLIARNAATLPEGLVDAELFGTARNYPNVGSPERAGLIGEADGSFLFLDEIGELSPALQAHLLRVLDRGGEYQRLGESRLRRSDIRLIGATNRDLAALKHDFAARFTSRIELPGLEARREDIPLLLRTILQRAAAQSPAVADRFFSPAGADGEREPRVDPWLVEGLLRHRFTLHTRELERLVWRAIATSTAEFVGLTPEVRAELKLSSEPATADPGPTRAVVSHAALGRDEIVAALAAASGRTVVAAEKLGLRNRYVLYRLMKKFGIQITDD
ncbi:MAG: sigma-54-dependent Fis family transcriptional regulator [Myxococcales bacterium]|nr:sigma-54-dependent Fis family transcriptional regulator [Myxococcales bacterium]